MNELEILIQANLNVNQSIPLINKNIAELEKKIEKLKLQATLDNEKSKSAIAKEIEKLNKQKRQLYLDLKFRKDSLTLWELLLKNMKIIYKASMRNPQHLVPQ